MANREWKFGQPGYAIVGYLNNANIFLRQIHDAIHEPIKPHFRKLTMDDGTVLEFEAKEPDFCADWNRSEIASRLWAIKERAWTGLRDWRVFVMRDAAKLHMVAEFTARLDEIEAAIGVVFKTDDIVTTDPLYHGVPAEPRVNFSILTRRLHAAHHAVTRADWLIKFFEQPERPKGSTDKIHRAPGTPAKRGLTTKQLADRLECDSSTVSRMFRQCGVTVPARGVHSHVYDRTELQLAADYCLKHPDPRYVQRGKALRQLMASADAAKIFADLDRQMPV